MGLLTNEGFRTSPRSLNPAALSRQTAWPEIELR
jgi:hypothetical protein